MPHLNPHTALTKYRVARVKKKKIQPKITRNHFNLRMIIIMNKKMQVVSFLPLSTTNNQLSTRAMRLFYARMSGVRGIIKGCN